MSNTDSGISLEITLWKGDLDLEFSREDYSPVIHIDHTYEGDTVYYIACNLYLDEDEIEQLKDFAHAAYVKVTVEGKRYKTLKNGPHAELKYNLDRQLGDDPFLLMIIITDTHVIYS